MPSTDKDEVTIANLEHGQAAAHEQPPTCLLIQVLHDGQAVHAVCMLQQQSASQSYGLHDRAALGPKRWRV